jgi:hypothetical protein
LATPVTIARLANRSRAHDGSEALHALEALGQGLTPEVEDQLADAEPLVRANVLGDLIR